MKKVIIYLWKKTFGKRNELKKYEVVSKKTINVKHEKREKRK